ncbi:mRNA cap guanine-N7 methyltransferase 1 [Symbiodinium microadriaticum]|uniref:mRNA (guanine-N(7))-methyltransferase n=1 Tax=Symbiodinium microadriaticum TaxID=2951 RepID=A0A1Q9ESF1_SYMMI|nr:mRNA cap guanine-N7 methyltransferase 1 [Symbiodinium microadriaticum]
MTYRGSVSLRAEAAAQLHGQLQVVQMVGQDSFEQALGRSSDAKASRKGRGKGILATGIHFLVFPRGHGGADVQVPRHMKDRVEIVKDYVDPVLLSSTDVRELACTSEGLSGRVHPALQQQVMEIYTRPRQFFLLFLGPPGSGKTTLGRQLEAALGFYHLSGGEAYRAAKARTAASTRPEAQQQTVAKVFAALALAAARLKPAPVSFDGFLPKDLPDFEDKVGHIGLIVKLQCSSEVLRQRIGDRGSRPHDVTIDAEKRVASYEQRSTREDAALGSFGDSAGIVCELDADAPLHEVLEAVQGLVRQAADRHQIKLPEVVQEQGSRVLIDDGFWNQIFEEIESSPAQAYNLRRNATSMRARQGSRNLKNFNNLVKDILIQWGVREVSGHLKRAGQDYAAESQGCRLCYTAIDVAEAQVQEATNRLRQGLERQKTLKQTLLAARFFVGDVAQVAPQQPGMPDEAEPQWFHVASIQFALHYAFSSCETAQSFLRHAAGNLCSRGLLLITTVDASQMARIAAEAQDLVYESELLRVTFPDADIHEIQKGIARYGLRYRFDLAGEGIDCEEFVVPEELLTDVLRQLDIDIIASVPFSELSDPKGGNTSREVAKCILQRLGESVEDIADAFGVYDNLGLKLSAPEHNTVSLYKRETSSG